MATQSFSAGLRKMEVPPCVSPMKGQAAPIMANIKKSVAENVAGEFFVDSTCIDCDTCRQLAPGVFEDTGETSYVRSQPATNEETRAAVRALLACPTGSIGTLHPNNSSEIMEDFPFPIEENVFY